MRGTGCCRFAAIALCLLPVAGCHAATASAPVSSDRSSPRPASALERFAAPVRDYLRELVSDEPAQVRRAVAHSAPGSPAATYAEHRANRMQAQLGGALTLYPGTVQVAAHRPAVRLCNRARSSCLRLGDFRVDHSGKLRTFTVDGHQLGPRLVAGDGGPVAFGLGSVRVLTAFRTVEDSSLVVTLRLRAGDRPLSPRLYRATFRTADGTRHTAVNAFGATDVPAHSDAVAALVFPAAPPKGEVTVGACLRTTCREHASVTVDVP